MKKGPSALYGFFVFAAIFVLGGVSKNLFATHDLAIAVPVATLLACGCAYLLAD